MDAFSSRQRLLILFLLCLIFNSCRKDISVPKTEFKKLFGHWQWIESSGGFSGGIESPVTAGYTIEIEFNENGIYKKYKNGEKINKMTFEFIEGESIFSSGKSFMIHYDGFLFKKEATADSFKFSGEDTLYLMNECYDCYTEMYVRK